MIVDVRGNPVEARRYRAFLNGVDVSDRCFYADDQAGEVRCYKRNDAGQIYCDPVTREPAEETLYGQVRLVLRSEEASEGVPAP